MNDRDHFAAAALSRMTTLPGIYDIDIVARQAFELADAMIRERERTGNRPTIDGFPVPPAAAAPVSRPAETRASFSHTNHDAAPAATARTESAAGEPGGGCGTGETQEPVAWAVAIGQSGYLLDDIFLKESAAREALEWRNSNTTYGARILPLYRHPQPMLTDAEREAIEAVIESCGDMTYGGLNDERAAVRLRRLLERLK